MHVADNVRLENRKSSNGRKIARMARNLTIFGPNRSHRRELKFENFSNERANEQFLFEFFWIVSAGPPRPRPELSLGMLHLASLMRRPGSFNKTFPPWVVLWIVNGAAKKSKKRAFDRGGPVWPPGSNAKDDRKVPKKNI